MKVTIGFSRNKKIFSRLIQWFTRSNVSHVYIKQPSEVFGEDLVFHAAGIQVNCVNYKYFCAHQEIVEEFEVDVDNYGECFGPRFVVQSLGVPYGWPQVFGFAWVLVCKAAGIKVRNPWNDGAASYICSELVATYLQLPDAENLTPDELRRLLKDM